MKPAQREHSPERPTLDDAEIAKRFRGAVEGSCPEFSTDLHAQVMRSLRTRRPQDAIGSPPRLRLHPWHIAALTVATAAIVVLAVSMAIVMAGRRRDMPMVKGPDPVRHPTPSGLPLTPPRLSDAMVAYVDPVKTRLQQAPRAFFFHSADRLQHYCLNQLRIFPSRPQRNPAEEPATGSPSAG